MLSALSERITAHAGSRHTLQAIITKVDTLGLGLDAARAQLRRIRKDVFDAAPTCLPPLVTSVQRAPYIGVENVRAAIADACGLARLP
jgi:GTP-binding protein